MDLAALMFLFDRNFYLPFLGPCAVPVRSSYDAPAADSTSVKLTGLPPNTTVIYWGALSSEKSFTSYKDAYGDYSNSGVATTNDKGEVVVSVSCPGQYFVKKFGMLSSQLPKHIQYRYETSENKGLLSEVFTKAISC